MLPLESCFITSGLKVSLEPVDTGRDAAGTLASHRMGDCLLAIINDAERPKLMGTMFRRRAERAIRRVDMLIDGRKSRSSQGLSLRSNVLFAES